MTLSGLGYICSAGESFDSAARAVYGHERYAAELLNANPELCAKLTFEGGEILRLPVVEVASSDEETAIAVEIAPWKRA